MNTDPYYFYEFELKIKKEELLREKLGIYVNMLIIGINVLAVIVGIFDETYDLGLLLSVVIIIIFSVILVYSVYNMRRIKEELLEMKISML